MLETVFRILQKLRFPNAYGGNEFLFDRTSFAEFAERIEPHLEPEPRRFDAAAAGSIHLIPLFYGSWGGWSFLVLDERAGTLPYSMTDTRGGAEDESTVLLAMDDLETIRAAVWRRPTREFLECAKQSLYYFHSDPKPF